MSRKAYGGLLTLAVLLVLFVLFIGNLIWGETWQVPTKLSYDILRDTLTITLTVLAVGIAVVGYLIYQNLSVRLQVDSARAAHNTTIGQCTKLCIYIGFIFWQTYEKRRRGNRQYLEMAIDFTQRGLMYFGDLTESESKTQRSDELLCKIKNNLGYYFAERNNPEDKELSRECADYIRERILKYPQHKENWLDTCTFIEEKYPN